MGEFSLGIIGAGNMAEAIVRGILKAKLLSARSIIAFDPLPQRRELFERELGVSWAADNVDAAVSRVVLLCVKPQQMADVLKALRGKVSDSTLFISIAAGVSTALIEQTLGGGRSRVVRCMPNTPMLVGEGMAAIAPGAHATADDLADARRIFEPAATVVEVREEQMDAVTAVSGSGPAYFFFLVEQMIAAGVALGLSPEQAHLLATRTASGAARMLTASSDAPQELRRKVTSPGGTTQAAIAHLETHGVGPAIVEAIKAADRRGKELGK